MNDEAIQLLGDYCEQLMMNDMFNAITQQYDLQCWDHFGTTEEHETKKRDAIFFKRLGVKEFLGHMAAIIEQRNALSKTAEAAEDAQDEDVD